MAFSLFRVLKGLLITEEGSLTPKEIEIVPGGTTNTKSTIVGTQSSDVTISLPDATDTLVARATPDTLTNKNIVAANNTITVAATNVTSTLLNGALTEIQGNIDAHISQTTDAHDASAISVTPTLNLDSTDVQSALVELQGDVNDKASRSLNNLQSTSISADLLPAPSSLINIGSSSNYFNNAFLTKLITSDISDSSSLLSINPTQRRLFDSSGFLSLNYGSRQLYTSNGGAQVLTWGSSGTSINAESYPLIFSNVDYQVKVHAPKRFSLSANISTATTVIQVSDKTLMSSAIVEYQAKEVTTNAVRVGQLFIVYDGTTVSMSEAYNQSSVIGNGLEFTVALGGAGNNFIVVQASGSAANIVHISCTAKIFN